MAMNEKSVDLTALEASLNMVNGYLGIYNDQGQIVFMNRPMMAWLGLDNENVTEGGLSAGLEITMESGWSDFWNSGEKERLLYITAADQSNRAVRARIEPFQGEEGSSGGILLLEDVTEQARIQSEMEDSEKQLAHVIESSPDPMLVIDASGKVLQWNRAMVEMTGYPAEEMVGKSNYEYGRVFYGEARPILVDLIINPALNIREKYPHIQQDGDILTTDNTPTMLKGEPCIMWGRAAPLYDHNGNIVGAVETIRDITERRQQEEALKNSRDQLEELLNSTVHALAITTEKRDHYTSGHQQRVANLACAMGIEMGLEPDIIENIRTAGVLHDIGKLFVPMDILGNTSDLREIEKLFLMTHSEAGFEIVKDIPFPGPIALIIEQHHERIDGSGYPFGLKGEEILLEARILAVADTVEAMASHRPYRPALGIDKALEEIEKNAGIKYDEDAVRACVTLIRDKGYQVA